MLGMAKRSSMDSDPRPMAASVQSRANPLAAPARAPDGGDTTAPRRSVGAVSVRNCRISLLESSSRVSIYKDQQIRSVSEHLLTA
jgi:hypothetical protein